MKVVVVYHSQTGHTRALAQAVWQGAREVAGGGAVLLSTEEARGQMECLDQADAIVFGSPTYMGNMSADMKAFLEGASGRWLAQTWRGKIAGAFTDASNFSGDKLNTLVGLMINAMQHGMIYVGNVEMPPDDSSTRSPAGPGPDALNRVGSFLGPMSTSFAIPAPQAPPPGDLETARRYGEHLARVARQFLRGREAQS